MRDPDTFLPPLLELKHISQRFRKSSDLESSLVLDDVSLTLKEGEIVGLLGRSGCGKSSLLRIASGLISPIAGEVRYKGTLVDRPVAGISMVFQSAALFPWLSVLGNVELGLHALKIPADEVRHRAVNAIDLIGLDGFESAYPRELSGGMRQRVGFARAFVMRPNILFMDEPFSALDVLTAETLRTDLIDLWVEGRIPIQSLLMVTHNIEEAVLMCDRIVLLSSNPGRIAEEIRINLAHPRDRLDPEFRKLVDQIYAVMTQRPLKQQGRIESLFPGVGLGMSLPRVSTNAMAGLLEEVLSAPYNGQADMPHLADSLQMEVDDLFPMAETLQLLRFIEMEEGDIKLTASGKRFAEAAVDVRKKLFAESLIAYVPLAARIRQVLDERPSHRAPFTRFQEEIEDYMSEEYAERTLRTVIDWGRYGEIFAYDETTHGFSLENPQ